MTRGHACSKQTTCLRHRGPGRSRGVELHALLRRQLLPAGAGLVAIAGAARGVAAVARVGPGARRAVVRLVNLPAQSCNYLDRKNHIFLLSFIVIIGKYRNKNRRIHFCTQILSWKAFSLQAQLCIYN